MTGDLTVFLIVPSAVEEAPEADRVASALCGVCEEWRRFGHVWLVRSAVTSDAIRDQLLSQPELAASQIMVMSAGRDAAWIGFSEADTDWLVNRL